MDREQLLRRFFEVVAFSLRHPHYKHTLKKAELYEQLIAGKNLDSLLSKFVRRETEILFKQRVELTNHIVTTVTDNLLDVFYKVPRSNSARRVLTYTGDGADEKKKNLEKIMDGFWGKESWDDYLSTRYIQLKELDPNAFVVFEWDTFDPNKEFISPRPFEVYSKMAIDYRKDNNELEYLIVQQDHTYMPFELPGQAESKAFVNPTDKIQKGNKYTLYTKKQTFQLIEVDDKEVNADLGTNVATDDGQLFKANSKQYVKLGQKFYEFREYKAHNLGYVNAVHVGHKGDPATHGRTYVNSLHRVEPLLLKTIKVNSEFDLVATLLALPQLLKYGKACVDENCYEGHYTDGSACKTCNGTGVMPTAMSAQDAIVIKMPNSREEMIPLDQLMTYLHPPVDIIKWQEEYIDKLTEQCKTMLHNSDTFTKTQVAETATGKNLDMQNIYDTLFPFAVAHGKTWTFGTKCIADLADLGQNLVAKLSYGKDFKLKSLDTLIDDLARSANSQNPALQKTHPRRYCANHFP